MVGTGWLPNNYTYYHQIDVTNGSGGDLTNYQIQVIVNRGAPGGVPDAGVYYVDEGDLRSDFADIRFTDSSYNSLPYWLEYISSVRYRIWVKVPSIPTAGCTIYMFTGNPNENRSESNGEKVFEFFDDFLGSSLDATKWPTSSGTTLANSIATITNGNIRTTQTFATNIALRTNASMQNSGNCNIGQSDLTSNWILFQGNYPTTNSINARSGTSATESTANLGAYTGYHIFEYQRNSSSAVYYWVDGIYKTSISTNVPSGAIILNFGAPSGVTESLDWILVRKYTATEPTVSVAGHGGRSQVLPHILIQKNDWQYTEE